MKISENTTFPSTTHRDSRRTIGMLGHDVSNTHNLVQYIVKTTQEQGVNLIHLDGGLVNSLYGFESQANIIYNLIDKDLVDGLIIEGVIFHYAGSEEMKRLCESYAPLPVVTHEVPISGVPRTYIDFYQGLSDILTHVIDVHGARRIAFIRGPEESITAEERYRAYRDTLAHHDIPFDERLVAPGTFFAPSGADALELWLDQEQLRPGIDIQAIVAVNDFTAFDVIEHLQQRGIRVPQEVAVTGFDDSEVCRLTTPPLTTARMSLEDVSYPLIKLLLDRIGGHAVPEQVMLPVTRILRESCGCLDPAMLRAVTPRATSSSNQPFEVAVAERRASITDALEQSGGKIGACLASGWAEMLLDAFLKCIVNDPSGRDLSVESHFWALLDEFFHDAVACKKDMAVWHDIFSELRRHLLPCFDDSARLAHAENVWQQIRIKISRNMERVQRCRRFEADQLSQTMREIEQTLLITFHTEELMDVLAEELPRVDIRECYLALYDEPQRYHYPQAAPSWSRLMMAYTEEGRIPLPDGGQRFRSRQILPDPFLQRETPYALDVWPLYFRDMQLGFIVFDIRFPHNRTMYNALRKQISNALQGALLVQQIEQHAAELTRKQYILDSFMENIPDRIYFKDLEGRITKANKAHALRFGLNHPDEELGKTVFDFFPEEEARKRYAQELEIIRNGRPLLNLEEETTECDGSTLWALTTKMPLRNEYGDIIGTFGISRDISDLKQAEQDLLRYRDHLEELVNERTQELTRSNDRLHNEILERTRAENALRVSEQQYRMLAENVNDGIVILQDTALVFANSTFAAMVGYSTDVLLMSDPLALVEHPALRREHADNETRLHTAASEWQMELLRRNGAKVWVEIEQTAIAWNNLPASLLTIHDITSRKQQEQRLEEERARLEQENITLKSAIKERYRFGELVGKSPLMQRVYEFIISAASSDVNVLISGESGTGKELIARSIHQVSPRKNRAFVPVNCASIPETLFEREFFGHHRGAFTSADRNKPGLFDRAHRGVLFLDEVTELSPGTQAKLLRVLQDGEYSPLGSSVPKQADVLIVAATNKDIQEEIHQGRLRKDFFYRICVVEINVPPLQARKDDLPLLIEHILDCYRRRQTQVHGSLPSELPLDQTMLPAELVYALYSYHWPGNIRELQNLLQRYLVTKDLKGVLASLGMAAQARTLSLPENLPDSLTLPEAVQRLEKEMIEKALKQTQRHIVKTAELLGIPRSSLYRKLKHYNLNETG